MSLRHYASYALGGAALGAAAVAFALGLGAGGMAATGAMAGASGASAAGAVGGLIVGGIAAYVAGSVVLACLGVLAVLKMFSGDRDIKLGTCAASVVASGVLTAAAMTGYFSEQKAARVTDTFNDSCKTQQMTTTDGATVLVVPKGCKASAANPG